MANNERVTNLVIRAKDEYSKVLKNLEAQQKRLSAAAQATNRRMVVGVATKEVSEAQRNYKALSADVERYRAAQEKAARTGKLSAAETRELGEAIALTRRRAQEAVATYGKKTAALNQLKTGATSGFAAFDRLAVSMQKSTVSSNAEGAAVQGVVADLKILDQQSRKVVSSQNAVAGATDKATDALNRRNGKGGRKGEAADVEVYGLKPYQLTNLGYQVNDVISGFVMGQNPIQILAQQAGQFVQIWPGVMTSLARSIPVIAGVSAALSPFIAALIEVGSKSRALTEFTNRLSIMADGANYSAEALTKITRNFEELKPLLDAGFSQDQLQGFYTLAQTLSRANGESLVDNVKTLAEAFSGGVSGVRELDKSLQFLTAEQYKNIVAMEASGDKTGALVAAQKALETRYDAFSGKAKGPWAQAWNDLGQAWNRLIKWISTTAPITITIGVLNKLGQAVQSVTGAINLGLAKLTDSGYQVPAGGLADRYGQLRKQKEELTKLIAESRASDEAMFGPDAKDSSQTQLYRKQLEATKLAYDTVVKLIKEGHVEETKTTAETEEQKKNRTDILLTIDAQVKSLQQQADLAKMTERQQFIENQLLEAKNRALEAGVNLRSDELDILKRQAGETFDSQQGVSSNLVDKIVGVESGGNANAKNPLSSATGLGQFSESTWLALFKKYFPTQAAAMTEQQILDLRKDSAISRAMIEAYAEENKKVLQAAGVSVNDAALYLAHFLGPRGAAGILAAKPGTSVADILGADQINANKSILQGKTNDEVIAWAQKKMGISESELDVQNRIAELDAERLKTSKEYTEDYQKRIEAQKFELDLASKSAREAAIAKAIQEEELKAKEAGVKLTQAQIDEITKLTSANFDRANAETRVNELMEQRTMLMESLSLAQEAGDSAKVAEIVGKIQDTEDELNTAIEKAILFYQAMGGPAADAAILKLQNLKNAVGDVVKDMATKYLPTAEELNDQIVDMGGNAFSAFAEAIAQGKNAWEAFTNAVLQGLADILIELGKAIVKQALFNALTGGGSNTSGGIGGLLSGWIGGLFGVAHTGGIIGQTRLQTKMVNPAVFANARRYHGGGIIDGLKSNEVPIIAEAGEEMLTRNDPRHSANGGAAGLNVKIVNVLDPSEILEAAVESVPGEKIMVNHMSRRRGAYKTALGT